MSLFTRTGVMQTEISFNLFLSSIPRRALQLRSTENVVGDIVRNAKDCTDVYDGEELKDVHFAHFASKLNDSQDVNWGFDAELQYEVCVTGLSCSRIAFCIDTWPSIHDLYYSAYCQGGTANCFGCVGLQKYEFCILNQQYSREEYEVLIPRIITHMQKTGEWGKFFPAALSPFGYNQTTAQEYLPLSKAQALSLGFYWADLNQEDQSAHNDKEVLEVVTDDIRHVSDTLTSNVFRCQKSNKLFRILRSELQWYRSQEIPLPRHHPDERHRARIARRNPCVIRQDLCASCGRGTTTTYAAEQQLQILCEECYRARE